MTDKTKKLLHSYGFFTCILLLMFTILLLVVYFSRNCGHKTIIKLLQEKLDTFYETEYKIGESVNMTLPLSSSSYTFSVDKNTDEVDVGKIIAIRMIGNYGPTVGVFFYTKGNVEFLGTIGLPENNQEYLWNSISKKQIQYWSKNIENVFGETIEDENVSEGDE
ncbi:MAG: hypothetical protein IJA53_06640 [Spirochaetaceae bacterium]|nr:hypothetical protein [Spirochaetaceae bacterium]